VQAALRIAGLRKNALVKLLSAAAQIADHLHAGERGGVARCRLILGKPRWRRRGCGFLTAGFAATAVKSLVESSVRRPGPTRSWTERHTSASAASRGREPSSPFRPAILPMRWRPHVR
jgi:hypothetical protein